LPEAQIRVRGKGNKTRFPKPAEAQIPNSEKYLAGSLAGFIRALQKMCFVSPVTSLRPDSALVIW
jgi:hypothetical protein